jgi:hypothetical protein
MKYPSPADIEQMRARGYNRSTIEDAIERSGRWHEKERVKEHIRSAFGSVRLGHGIGLHEAQAIDDYASDDVRARNRANDEKHAWAGLKAHDLNECYSSLSFFDAEGMRFHLPAYMCADLDGEYGFELVYSLVLHGRKDETIGLLNDAQRAAVRAYLEFIVMEPDCVDRALVEAALAGYWSEAGAT